MRNFVFFSDLNDSDPAYHFSGVTFGTVEDEVIISDEQCNAYLQEACDRYLEENPGDHALLTCILRTVAGESAEKTFDCSDARAERQKYRKVLR